MNALPAVAGPAIAMPDMPAPTAPPAAIPATGDFMALIDLSGAGTPPAPPAPPIPAAPETPPPDIVPMEELLVSLIAQPAVRIVIARDGEGIEPGPPTPLPAPPVAGAAVADAPPAAAMPASPALPAMHPFPLEMAQKPAGPIHNGGDARELALDEAGLAALARDIAMRGAGDRVLRFQLHPASLGALTVEIAGAEGAMQVAFTAESEAARAALSDAQARLIAEARAQGVRLEELRFALSSGQEEEGQRRQAQREPAPERPERVTAGDGEPSATEESLTPRQPRFPQDRFA